MKCFFFFVFYYFFDNKLQKGSKDSRDDILSRINQMHTTALMPDINV